MDFKVRKVASDKLSFWDMWHKRIAYIAGLCGVVLLITGLGLAVYKGYPDATSRIRSVVKSFGVPLDSYGHTNLLLLGTGGKSAEGGYLTDSVMLVSINPADTKATLLSLPRDYFIVSKTTGNRKLNTIFASEYAKSMTEEVDKYGKNITKQERQEAEETSLMRALQDTKKAVSELANTEIHYAAIVDFKLFEDAIDVLGGIEIDVPKTLYDAEYPDDNYGYQVFRVDAGKQVFDGDKALKYVRSRHSTSDYDRAERQQLVLMAVKNKVLSKHMITDTTLLTKLYDTYKTRITTDISFTEMLALMKLAPHFTRENILSIVLSDDTTRTGGVLYTPDKHLYGGAFVLRPYDTWLMKEMLFIALKRPEVLFSKPSIAVYNASGKDGVARKIADKLIVLGFNVVDVDNAKTDTPLSTSIFYARQNVNNKAFEQYLYDAFKYKNGGDDDTKVSHKQADYALYLGVDASYSDDK